MNKIYIPEGYKPVLNEYETQRAIAYIKETFQQEFSNALNLKRVSAPLFVTEDSGLNDNLNGYERAVDFDIPAVGKHAQVVHSLAKWKRLALKQYNFSVGGGLYTDMNAIRREEELDNIHSIYVDQWDWEKVITREERTEAYLRETVKAIVGALYDTQEELRRHYPAVTSSLPKEPVFVTTEELLQMYPDKTAKERENAFLKEHKCAFIMQIGDVLSNGEKHDGRAPDYDDWSLNGDILYWNDVLGCAFEISSMGIRVDRETLALQLQKAGCEDRSRFLFHQMLLSDTLPLTIGGGVGQSRVCMLLLGKAHVGQVQVSVWDDETVRKCKEAGITLL